MRRLFLAATLVCTLAACKQGKGERCQINTDCSDGLICSTGNKCEEPVIGGPDAGTIDAHAIDAHPVDAARFDAAAVDARPVDAHPIDAQTFDAQTFDAKLDAGP